MRAMLKVLISQILLMVCAANQTVKESNEITIGITEPEYQEVKFSSDELNCMTELDLSNLNFLVLSEVIGKLKNIRNLNAAWNRLESLPESISNLENLTKISVLVNSIKELPWKIGNLQELTFLIVGVNKLITLPDSICNLENLEILDFCSNMLIGLPENIGNMRKLKILQLSNNALTDIPASMSNLKSLKELYLNGNFLSEHSIAKLGGLKNLEKLYLDDNQLMELPDSLGSLTKLKRLFLNGNALAELPDSLKGCENLEVLNLCDNCLDSFPNAVLNLEKLEYIFLNSNNLTHLPSEIEKLKDSLKCLCLKDNKLKYLPSSIRKFGDTLNCLDLSKNPIVEYGDEDGKKLGKRELCEIFGEKVVFDYENTIQQEEIDCSMKSDQNRGIMARNENICDVSRAISRNYDAEKLDVSENKLTELPESVKRCQKLRILDLSGNYIFNLPKSISNLKKLKHLDLQNNLITCIPKEIEDLQDTLEHLDLRGNPIAAHCQNGNLGREELRAMFGKRVKFDNCSLDAIQEAGIYRKLEQNDLHWDFNELKKLRLEPVPEPSQASIKKLESLFALSREINDVTSISKKPRIIADDRLGITFSDFEENKKLTAKILSGWLDGLILSREISSPLAIDAQKVFGNILKPFLYRPGCELRWEDLIYDEYDYDDKDDMEKFVKNFLAIKKNAIFDQHKDFKGENKGAYALSIWKLRLRETLGLEMYFDARTILLAQEEFKDPFNRDTTKALDTFFAAFPPETVIKEIVKFIRYRDTRRKQIILLDPKKIITEDYVEKLLVESGILKKKGFLKSGEPDQSDPSSSMDWD